jgi:hypothetical protein
VREGTDFFRGGGRRAASPVGGSWWSQFPRFPRESSRPLTAAAARGRWRLAARTVVRWTTRRGPRRHGRKGGMRFARADGGPLPEGRCRPTRAQWTRAPSEPVAEPLRWEGLLNASGALRQGLSARAPRLVTPSCERASSTHRGTPGNQRPSEGPGLALTSWGEGGTQLRHHPADVVTPARHRRQSRGGRLEVSPKDGAAPCAGGQDPPHGDGRALWRKPFTAAQGQAASVATSGRASRLSRGHTVGSKRILINAQEEIYRWVIGYEWRKV